MTREEAIKEINKEFEPAFANYMITALTEGATKSDGWLRFSRREQMMSENKEKNITEELEEVMVNVCHNFCKYNNKGKCQWIAEGHECPLNKLC